jgi:DNA (cytosine-5)-methyltransferase 1
LLKIIELFAGIGSQTKALQRLGVEHEVVAISEINSYAFRSYEAIHGAVNNMGDITKIEKLPYADLWTYSYPCQSISVAGKQEGFEKDSGTRSSLLWEVERLLTVAKLNNELPKYLLLENVKNLVSKKFKPQFDEWIKILDDFGYNTYWKVLNAKHFGIPQSRERVFGVSIRKDIDDKTFKFPEPFDNGLRLKDFLESNVDEKYYISKDKTEKLIESLKNKTISNTIRAIDNHAARTGIMSDTRTDYKEPKLIAQTNKCDCVGRLENVKGHDYLKRVYSADGCCPTIPTVTGGGHEPKILEDFYANREVREYDECPTLRADRQGLKVIEGVMHNRKGTPKLVDICNTLTAQDPSRTLGNYTPVVSVLESGEIQEKMGNMRDLNPRKDGITNTITTVQKDNLLYEPQYRMRKLTEIESWKLMGFDKEDVLKCKAIGISNSQLYKQAGNSIVVNVLEKIFENLFCN